MAAKVYGLPRSYRSSERVAVLRTERAAFAESLEGVATLQPRGGAPTLTLVTCGGRFDYATRGYEDRRVVRAVLVAPRV